MTLPTLALLAATTAAQFGETTNEVPPRFDPDDSFTYVVEENVYAFGTARSFGDAMDGARLRLLRRLACEHYDCREAASRDVRSLGSAMLGPLVWGSHAKDKEMAHRCRSLLEEWFACPRCEGRGYRTDYGYGNAETTVKCYDCQGIGTVGMGMRRK